MSHLLSNMAVITYIKILRACFMFELIIYFVLQTTGQNIHITVL